MVPQRFHESFLVMLENQAHAQNFFGNELSDVLLVLFLSGVIIPALQKVKVSPVLGYLLSGLLIGPYGFGGIIEKSSSWSALVITNEDLIHLLAELGVVFLLFMIGLELTFSRLWDLRRLVLGLGSVQILITGVCIFLVALKFNNSLPTSILVGAAFSLSSTAIVMQLLTEWHMLSRPIGRICFSVLLMQDLAVVPILVLVGAFSGHEEGTLAYLVTKAVFTAVVVVLLIFVIGKLLLRPLLRSLSPSQNAEWLFAVVLAAVIGTAGITYSYGLSAALGAFLAGLLLAETEYRHEIEVIIEPLKGVLIGVFFMSVGMQTDIRAIAAHPFWLPASVIGIFVIKALLFYPVARVFGVPCSWAAQGAFLLAQCGEFAFLVIGLALQGNVLPEANAQFFLLVAAFSMLLTPLTTRLAPWVERLLPSPNTSTFEEGARPSEHSPEIIIAGFGRVGQTLATILEESGTSYVAIEKNGAVVAESRANGYPVIFGDARRVGLWKRLNIENAKVAVITIDDYFTTAGVLSTLRHEYPLLTIVVRVKDTRKVDHFYSLGATVVVPETLEATLRLGTALFEHLGMTTGEVDRLIDMHRKLIMTGESP